MKPIILGLMLLVTAVAEIKVTKEQGRVSVDVDGKPFTALYFGPDTMKPYLHPLRTASGQLITRQYPMEKVENETRDHPHHQGVWFTHGDVNGFDFWANPSTGPKKGRVMVDKITKAQSGAKAGVIGFEARWLDAQDKALLKESREMRFSADGENRVVDFDITLTALNEEVKFGDTKEGTFAIRIADSMTEKSKGGMMTNAAGATTMKNIWGKPSPWVDYAGKLGSESVGIAIFDHPKNPKHPTTWHARDYGLFAANIFGQHDFYPNEKRDGSVTLAPGKALRFRYRVVIHPGDGASANVAKLYESYAKK